MNTRLPDPKTSPELFEGILFRRSAAFIIDTIIISIITFVLFVIIAITGVITLGFAWLTFPIIAPIAILSYYALTLGSNSRATFGMQMFDIILAPTKGKPLDGIRALAHPLVYWITIWVFSPLLFIGLFTQRRQLIHDFITSTMMVRRSPMEYQNEQNFHYEEENY